MNRRDTITALIALGATAGPLCDLAWGQQARRPYRIALLPDFLPAWAPLLKAFVEALRELGRIEGRDFVFYRSGIFIGQDVDRSVKLVVDEKPDLILTSNLSYAIAAHRLTKTIPIVMRTSGFPVEGDVAVSLARPGKNVTGLTIYAGTEVFGPRWPPQTPPPVAGSNSSTPVGGTRRLYWGMGCLASMFDALLIRRHGERSG